MTSSSKFLEDLSKMKPFEASYPVPRSVRVMGRDVPINMRSDMEEGDDGEFNYTKVCIDVREGLIPVEEMDVVLHETIHCIDYWLNLGLNERQVRLMATALIGVFQDNPDFAEFITRPLKAIE